MKRNLLILLAALLLCSFAGCSSNDVVVNIENEENIYNTAFGKSALVYIGDGLYYDVSTRIVYWWNGSLKYVETSTTPSPYYAPNGLPYRYNSATNTFEEINFSEVN